MTKHPILRYKEQGYEYGRFDSPTNLAKAHGESRATVYRNMQPRPTPNSTGSENIPTNWTLHVIRTWPIESNFMIKDLVSFCKEVWRDERGFWVDGRGSGSDRAVKAFTRGWKGDGLILAHLKQNAGFWERCWLSTERWGDSGLEYTFLSAPIGGGYE